ncbi:MAG: hypothetical protein QFB87_01025 [Patescibacteria group bacterium]|nr:hypothetical protein [Patescibacteria group bacterium]
MNKVTYDGRHTTNLITDIKPSRATSPAPESDRTGKANFLPFEEIGGSLGLGGHASQSTKKTARSIQVKDRDVPTKVDVSRNHGAAASEYTYVPPLRSLALSGVAYAGAASSNIISDFEGFLNQKLQSLTTVAHTVLKDLTTAARDFYELALIKRTTAIKITAGLAVGVLSILLLTQAISDPHAPSSSKIIHQPTAATSGNLSPTAVNTSGTPTASGVTTSPNPPVTTNSVGSGGGGSPATSSGASPTTTGSGSTPSLPAVTDPTLVPNPIDAVPYYQVTAPGTSVQAGGKQVIGTSPVTLTTN